MGTTFDSMMVSCAAIKKKNGWSASKWMGIWAQRFLRTMPAKFLFFKSHNRICFFSVHMFWGIQQYDTKIIIIRNDDKNNSEKKKMDNEYMERSKMKKRGTKMGVQMTSHSVI